MMIIKNNLIKFVPEILLSGIQVKAVPIKQHIRIKHKRKTNSANHYRSMIKQFGYSEEQIYNILLSYKRKHQHAHTGKRRRKSKRLKDNVYRELANRKSNGLSLKAIVKKHNHSITRMTLYRWKKQWFPDKK